MVLRICILVFLFLARLRFPSSKSIVKFIKDRYGESVLKLVRKFERTDLRCRKAELDLSFLKYCFENSLTPKFLRFKVSNRSLKSSDAYKQCQIRLFKERMMTHYLVRRSVLAKGEGQNETMRYQTLRKKTNFFLNIGMVYKLKFMVRINRIILKLKALLLKRSSNASKKQNNVDLFQSILCFALLFMILVLLWFFYFRARLLWAGDKFWCTCYWKVNLGIEVEIIQWYFLACWFRKSELCLTFSDVLEV